MHDPTVAGGRRLLEVSHVAHRLSASHEYVRRLIREGKLPAIRLGTRWRIDPLDLQAFLDAQRTSDDDLPLKLHAVPCEAAKGA